MPRTRNPYPAEFREQIVALARTGRSVEALAREFEPCAATIHGWIKRADRDGGRRVDGLTSQQPGGHHAQVDLLKKNLLDSLARFSSKRKCLKARDSVFATLESGHEIIASLQLDRQNLPLSELLQCAAVLHRRRRFGQLPQR